MNVQPGDMARIVDTGTVNDGAIVRVICRDRIAELHRGDVHWTVRGESLLGFRGDTAYPTEVANEVAAPDSCLRRIDPDEMPVDERESLGDHLPISAPESVCLTT